MVDTTAMPTVRLHYWAGARAAAGTEEDVYEAASLQAALELACAGRDDRFARVLGLCTVLVDGIALDATARSHLLVGPVAAEVLPPFAGGASRDSDTDLEYQDDGLVA